MTPDYSELDFSLHNRLLIVSWEERDIRVYCELDEARDGITWSWVTGDRTPQTRHIAETMMSAADWYLQEQKRPA